MVDMLWLKLFLKINIAIETKRRPWEFINSCLKEIQIYILNLYLNCKNKCNTKVK